ncbi:MAG: prepilin-type N-terminal cleavage/methylation domain-containing protein [Candidatus Shapirobacteria bacterium]
MKRKGFTLVELLVVMAIMAILASIAFGQYRNSQKKARDAQRKADLDNIARALEMYYSDHGSYPLNYEGLISVDGETGVGWTESFQADVGDDQTVVYMKRLPKDPQTDYSYCYFGDSDSFTLYAKLENDNDSNYCASGYTCNTDSDYRYAVASPNAEVGCE